MVRASSERWVLTLRVKSAVARRTFGGRWVVTASELEQGQGLLTNRPCPSDRTISVGRVVRFPPEGPERAPRVLRDLRGLTDIEGRRDDRVVIGRRPLELLGVSVKQLA